MSAKFSMPHPAIVCSGPQLLSVIKELEAGTYPQPEDAIWRGDLPRDLAERLARATGATDEQIAAIIAEPHAKDIPAEPTTWLVAVTAGGSTEHSEYRNGKDAHRVASDRSRAPGGDHATVTFNGCVTTYRGGTGTGPGEPETPPAEAPADPGPDPEPAPGCKRLTIKHTHEDGTLLYGSDKGDGVYELIGPRTGARFRFFPSIRMIGIAQSRDHLAKRFQIEMAAEALRKAGHVVTVEIDDTPRDVADVKADRAERLDTRYERLTAKAERNAAEAESRRAAADAIGERFAGGQPILVGHHSERRARKDQERIQQNDRAAHAAYREAERAQQAASVVGSADAYRERPDVIIRRIEKNEAELRKIEHHINGTRPANDWRGAYYAPESKPASGAWLEQLQAAKTFTEHQLAADREALAAHEAAGYKCHSRETIHVGDVVNSGRGYGGGTVSRVNPKTVSVPNRYGWTDKLRYEEIHSVECPHEGTTTTVSAPKREKARPKPEPVKIERPAERPAPVEVGAGTEFFPTPAPVVDRMLAAAGYEFRGLRVLEPSAGLGAIARPAAARGASVDCIELDHRLAGKLREAGFTVQGADFLEVTPKPEYDRVMMNPPFSGQADIRHVTHALGFLKPGGRLVAVMSAGAEFRSDKTAEAFRKLVADRGGRFERLPEDAFEASGTGARTVLVTIPAPMESEPVPVDEYAEAEAAGMLFA